MIKSMTGYARASASNASYAVVVEIRSVNHRYLDLRVRGASGLASLEKKIRDVVGAELSRGKVDVNINFRPQAQSVYEISVDRPLMSEFVRLAVEAGEENDIGGELTLSDLVSFSPAFQVKERDLSEGEGVFGALEPALVEAVAGFGKMRSAEGEEMAADIAGRIRELSTRLERVEARSNESRSHKREQLQARVDELLAGNVEPSTIAMEVARLVERNDVTEEITRLRSHLELWRGAVESDGPCGKKLDFIVQEMNREINTIGSKCQDATITEQVIAMKAEIERVREQVQNIE
jgi:uncharacterized protein (TIGR00255 family)